MSTDTPIAEKTGETSGERTEPLNAPYVQVGASGLFVHRAGLGTMQFGWSVEAEGAFAVMDAYAERGGNFIDTADCYSSWADSLGGPRNAGGVSEEIVGRWMKARGNREDIVLATKVRAAMGEQFADHRGTHRQREGLSRRWITRACEDSLRRLGTDHLDLYQAHWIDPLVPIEETLSVFGDLVRQGKVRYVGCSNFSAWRIVQALWASDVGRHERFVSVQPEYHLLAPTRGDFEAEIAQVCTHYGLGVFPYSPLAGGVLSGKYRPGEALPDSVRAGENEGKGRLDGQNRVILETLFAVAERTGRTPAQVAIGWLIAKPWVTAPILGANRPAQLIDVLDGIETALPAEEVAALDAASDFHRSRPSLEE